MLFRSLEDRGTGWAFPTFSVEGLVEAMGWALYTFRGHKDAWRGIQRRGMERDFSWDRSARLYRDAYEASRP